MGWEATPLRRLLVRHSSEVRDKDIRCTRCCEPAGKAHLGHKVELVLCHASGCHLDPPNRILHLSVS